MLPLPRKALRLLQVDTQDHGPYERALVSKREIRLQCDTNFSAGRADRRLYLGDEVRYAFTLVGNDNAKILYNRRKPCLQRLYVNRLYYYCRQPLSPRNPWRKSGALTG